MAATDHPVRLAAPALACALLVTGVAAAGPDTVLFGVDDPGERARLAADVAALGGTGVDCFAAARVCWADFPGRAEPPVDAVAGLAGVRYAVRDRPMAPPPRSGYADPAGTADCPDPWEMVFVEAGAAWTLAGGYGAAAPPVAVMDSGFRDTHEDLAGRVWGQYDYAMGDDVAEVEWSSSVPAHGTFMAGIVAANADDGVGRTGVVPEGSLFLQKISDEDGYLYFDYALAALADLVEGGLGVRVLAYSLSSDSTIPPFEEAFEALGEADVLAVVVAANCPTPNCADADNDLYPQYPGNFPYDHVLTVAGLLPDGSFNPMSHHGLESVDLAAPGASICSLGVDADDHYYTADGTSYAGPLVAGVAALMLATYPDLTAPELARMLRASAVDTPELEARVRSGGALSAAGALATPMPRLQPPDDVVVDGTLAWTPPLRNAAAAADATLLLFHDGHVAIEADGDWLVTPFEAGDDLALPDGAAHVATRAGAVIEGPLPAATAEPLTLQLEALQVAGGEATLRAVAHSAAADDLLAPHDGEALDETGYPARAFGLEVVALPSAGDDDDAGPPDGCQCRVADTAPPGLPLVAAGGIYLSARRRRSSNRGMLQAFISSGLPKL